MGGEVETNDDQEMGSKYQGSGEGGYQRCSVHEMYLSNESAGAVVARIDEPNLLSRCRPRWQ